jgi:hypothetical protein
MAKKGATKKKAVKPGTRKRRRARARAVEPPSISWTPLHGVLDFYTETYIPALLEEVTRAEDRDTLIGIKTAMDALRAMTFCKLQMVRFF